MDSQTKGICRLGLIPVRSEPNDRSEMVTQLLFGDHYTVLMFHENKKWLKIKIEFDGYEGWIDVKQHTGISVEYFNHLNNTEFKISTDITSTILYKKRLIQIVIGSMLPISSSELFEVHEQFAFNGASKNIGEKQGYEYLKQISSTYLNAPYLWGGKSPFGIDCSGLTQQLFKMCGYRLKRDARQQFGQGEKVTFEQTKSGDLAFFENENKDITHVGILMENGEVLHASGYVKKDKLDENGIYNEELSSYTHTLAAVRRIFKS